jgi:hypothetical protein
MQLLFQHMAKKTQSRDNKSSRLHELVSLLQVTLLLASCSPAELASSSDYVANKQIYFEKMLLCKMMLTTEGGELCATEVRTYCMIQSPFSFLNKHQIEIRVKDPLSRA